MKRDDLPANWDAITSQTSGSKVYTIAGSCSLDATFSAGKAVLKTKVEGDCTKPSFKVIFEKLFPAIQVSMTTEKFITLDKFDFEELTIATASKKVEVKGTARDSWRIAEKNLVLANAKLTLGFTAGKEITGIKDWEIHVEGMFFMNVFYTNYSANSYNLKMTSSAKSQIFIVVFFQAQSAFPPKQSA